jgi:hypothetical protein
MQGANRSNSELLRGFARQQGAHIGQKKFEIGCAPLLNNKVITIWKVSVRGAALIYP